MVGALRHVQVEGCAYFTLLQVAVFFNVNTEYFNALAAYSRGYLTHILVVVELYENVYVASGVHDAVFDFGEYGDDNENQNKAGD